MTRRFTRLLPLILVPFVLAGSVGELLAETPPSPAGAAGNAGPVPSPPATAPGAAPQPSKVQVPSLKPSRFPGSPSLRYRDAVLAEDTVWEGDVLVEGGVIVPARVTLTIRPGSTIRFRPSPEGGSGGVLFVAGRLQASGSAERPVLLTSDGVDPAPGDWDGVILAGTSKKNLLENARIEWAETGIESSHSTVSLRKAAIAFCRTGLRAAGSWIGAVDGSFTGCTFGVSAFDSEIEFTGVAVEGSRSGIESISGSLVLSGCTLGGNAEEGAAVEEGRGIVRGCRFSGNGSGLRVASSDVAVENNLFSGNRLFGLVLDSARGPLSGNDFAGNRRGGILVKEGGGAAWGNSFSGNGSCDIDNASEDDFAASGNWWGSPSGAWVETRVCDRRRDPSRGLVRISPPLPVDPRSKPNGL